MWDKNVGIIFIKIIIKIIGPEITQRMQRSDYENIKKRVSLNYDQ